MSVCRPDSLPTRILSGEVSKRAGVGVPGTSVDYPSMSYRAGVGMPGTSVDYPSVAVGYRADVGIPDTLTTRV